MYLNFYQLHLINNQGSKKHKGIILDNKGQFLFRYAIV